MSVQPRLNPLTLTHTNVVETPYSKDEWRIVECHETGMVYLDNPPDYSSLEETYAWEKQFEVEKQRRQQAEPLRAAISNLLKKLRSRLRKRETIEREAERLIMGQKGKQTLAVVDVGCGTGDKLQRICRFMTDNHGISIRPIGIEISKVQAEQAHNELVEVGGYCIQDAAIEGLTAAEDDSFDLIILCSFLEHEVNPLPLLRACYTKLVPDGKVLIKVPNYACKNRLLRQEKWCGFRYPDHVNYFTPDTLRQMLENAGLRCSELRAQAFNDNMWAVAERP